MPSPDATDPFTSLQIFRASPHHEQAVEHMRMAAATAIQSLRAKGALGLQRSEWIHLVGRPGQGKTTLILAFKQTIEAAGFGNKLAAYSREETPADCINDEIALPVRIRHAAANSGGYYDDDFAGEGMEEHQRQQESERNLKKSPQIILIDDLFGFRKKKLSKKKSTLVSNEYRDLLFNLFREVSFNPVLLVTSSHASVADMMAYPPSFYEDSQGKTRNRMGSLQRAELDLTDAPNFYQLLATQATQAGIFTKSLSR